MYIYIYIYFTYFYYHYCIFSFIDLYFSPYKFSMFDLFIHYNFLPLYFLFMRFFCDYINNKTTSTILLFCSISNTEHYLLELNIEKGLHV